PWRAHRLVAAPSAEREFDHVGLAERDHARRHETSHRGCRVVGYAPAPALGTGGRLAAGALQQILSRDGQAMERAAEASGATLSVERFGLRKRVVAPHLDEGVQLAVARVDIVDAGGDDLARADFAGRAPARELRQRLPGKIVGHRGRRYR